MPQLGETVTEGTISKWYKEVGDHVAAGEPLFEIETDKTSMEVPALESGILGEIRARAGQTVAVGAVVAVIGDVAKMARVSSADQSAAAPRVVATTASNLTVANPASPPPVPPIDPFRGVRTPTRGFGNAVTRTGTRITPLARRLAAQAGVEPAGLQGSGPQGRIVAADVRRTVAAGVRPAMLEFMPGSPAPDIRALFAGVPMQELPLDGMRRTIARRLVESKQQVPHFYLGAEFDAAELLALRKQFGEATGKKVSVNDLLVKAYALALQRVPAANVAWAGDRLLQFGRVDVGVAVAVPGGLVTPIVRDAARMPLHLLVESLADLVARARERRLQPHEYNGGSATLSNLGMYGVRTFQAIVNPPQATILAVGAAERRPVATAEGTFGLGTMMAVTLSVDHRAVDGSVAAELLAALRHFVEKPGNILL